MYKVIIKRDGSLDELMELREMPSGEVYKSVLSAIKGCAHMEKLSCYDRSYRYDAYVYKNDKFVYLIGLNTRFIETEWMGITRAPDLKTCVIRSII